MFFFYIYKNHIVLKSLTFKILIELEHRIISLNNVFDNFNHIFFYWLTVKNALNCYKNKNNVAKYILTTKKYLFIYW